MTKEFIIKYKKHPKPRKAFSSIDAQMSAVEDDLWWDAARKIVLLSSDAVPPAVWTFIVRTSDYWHYRNFSDNHAARLLAPVPIRKLLAGSSFDVLYETGKTNKRAFKLSPVRMVRTSDIDDDLMNIWQTVTTDVGRSIPLSRCATTDEVISMIETARSELGIEHYVKSYAVGVPLEDILL